MPRAQLHNGVELDFPPGTPDAVIDKAVRNFLAAKEEPKKRETEIIPIVLDIFTRLSCQIKEVRNSILSLPKPIQPEKVDLTQVEKSGATSAATLRAIYDEIQSSKKEIKLLRNILADIVKIVSRDTISGHADDIKKLILNSKPDLPRIADKLASDIGTGLTKHMNNVDKSLKDSHKSLTRSIDDAAESITKTLRAPKEIVKDKNGKPIGVRVKE